MTDNGPLEFTAVYERTSDGRISAYVAELDSVCVTARTLSAARARLAQKLRQSLRLRRADAVRRASPGARIEPLSTGSPPLRTKKPRTRAGQGQTARKGESGELELLQSM